jgi:[ribosomal protein S5]-alanine N-acetyltransferase
MGALPLFETDRLLLREVTERDEPAWTKHFVDYAVIRHLTRAVPWPYPEGGVLDFIRTNVAPGQGIDRWTWAICLKQNAVELIGCVDLWRKGRPANRGFWLAKEYWGRGFMTEAVRPVTDYAFTELGFEKLVFDNAKGNVGSRRIKEKMGAKLIRIEPAEFVDPAYTEREIWELTKDEWTAFRV